MARDYAEFHIRDGRLVTRTDIPPDHEPEREQARDVLPADEAADYYREYKP